jgi:hypothetical protein
MSTRLPRSNWFFFRFRIPAQNLLPLFLPLLLSFAHPVTEISALMAHALFSQHRSFSLLHNFNSEKNVLDVQRQLAQNIVTGFLQ